MNGNPQKEDGMTPFANELLEAIMRQKLNGYEVRVLLAIARKTYGWSKKDDYIALSQIETLTGIKKTHISRSLSALVKARIVTKLGNKIGINKLYSQWSELPNRVTVTQNGNTITQLGNKKLPNTAPQKKRKILIQKQYIYRLIFNFWNYKKIINHRKFDDKDKTAVSKILTEYTIPEVFESIGRYGRVIANKTDYYFTHRWTFRDFMARGFKRFLDTPTTGFLKSAGFGKPQGPKPGSQAYYQSTT